MINRRCFHREMNENEAGIAGSLQEHLHGAVADSFPAKINDIQLTEDSSGCVDLFSCALKTLSDRSPFDTEEGSTATDSTIPVSIVRFLSNKFDGKKKHKNSHSGVSSKFCRAEHLRGFNIWDETEVYFRCLKFKDVELLQDDFCSSSLVTTSILSDKHFFEYSAGIRTEIAERDRFEGNRLKSEDKDGAICHKTMGKKHGGMEISCYSDFEWLFGCRNKIFAPSECLSSRKRKRSSGDDDLEKLLEIWLEEKGLGLGRCHVCCVGEVGDELNRLVVCRLCNILVHQKCYGVYDYVDDSWLCSWCKYSKDIVKYDNELCSRFMHKPCVLCPKQGGALKAVDQTSGGVGFAHLFCSLWTPEVYVDDVRKMEPVMNVGKVSENLRKGTCYLCNAKNDPCMQCSHGRCMISFHPICGREAKHKFEIWGKFGCDVVELRAFCLQHSSVDGKNFPEEFRKMVSCVESGLEVDKTRSNFVDERDHQISNSNFKNKDENIMEANANGGKRDTCLLDLKSALGILKKLIRRGKTDVKNVASESGISLDLLASIIADNHPVDPDICGKIFYFLRSHHHISHLDSNLKTRSPILCRTDENSGHGFKVDTQEGKVDDTTAGMIEDTSPIMCNKLEDPLTVNMSPISEFKSEQLANAKNRGLLDFSLEDELEGELIYLQHQRLQNSLSLKHIIGKLISRIVLNLPKEIDEAQTRKWDDINVKQCIYKLREMKKHGRKERRQREAQAILAAATAAASTSARVSSRKNTIDASNRLQEQQKEGSARGTTSLKMSPQPDIGSCKGRSPICEICQRLESAVSPLLECYGCKVTVHLGCYRNVKDYTCPWYCELCEESCSRSSSAPVAVCAVCGGSSGAFRRCKDGRWVHSVCAELMLQTRFRRGQIEKVEGMETVSKAEGVCVICGKSFGMCIKCSYGHCRTMFHPYCAKTTGLYSCIKKTQHKAYCERHSSVQRAKDESHKYGPEELKNMKQIRVELERLRLLCERIIKREKIKREVMVCSNEILCSRRDSAAISALVQSRFVREMSSDSATTSLLPTEAVQRSDDSTLSSRLHHPLRPPPLSPDPLPRPPPPPFLIPLRPLLSAKKIPPAFQTSPSSHTPDHRDDSHKSLPEREMFQKEIMMTSDQALMKNRRLPKGYVYIPVPGRDETR